MQIPAGLEGRVLLRTGMSALRCRSGAIYFVAGSECASVKSVIATPDKAAFDRGVRPVLRIVPTEKARQIVRFRPDPRLQARIEELAEKSTEGQLSAHERSEYEGYVRANKFIAILQRQARALVSSKRKG